MPLHPWLDFNGSGRYGVFLFFVLSAYLLTKQGIEAGLEQVRTGEFWRNYARRRCARVLPLYLLGLTVYSIASSWRGLEAYALHPRGFLAALAMIDAPGVFWTIPVEFQYYAVLPGVVIAMLLLGSSLRRWMALAGAAIAAVAVAFPSQYGDFRSMLCTFLVGSSAALIQVRFSTARSAATGLDDRARSIAWDVAGWSALAIVVLCNPLYFELATGIHVPTNGDHFPRDQFLAFAVVWAVVLLAGVNGHGSLSRLLRSRALVTCGKISFGLYVWHMLVITLIEDYSGLPPALDLLLAAALCGGLASLSWVLIEKPALGAIRPRRRADRPHRPLI